MNQYGKIGKRFCKKGIFMKKILFLKFLFIFSNIYPQDKPFVLIYPVVPKKGEVVFLDIIVNSSFKLIVDSYNSKEIKPIKISDKHSIAIIPIDIEYSDNNISFTIESGENRYSYNIKVEEPVVREREIVVKRVKLKPENESVKKELLREAFLVNKVRNKFTEKLYINGSFIYPVKEIKNKDLYFGDARLIRFKDGIKKYYHRGIDFGAPRGTAVYASNGGIVVLSDNFITRGKTIIIDHGYGIFTEYLHLSKILVKKGQFVKKGELIGKIGSTGFSTGPHLHWSLLVNGYLVNPLQWVTPVISDIFSKGFNILGFNN